MPRKKTVKKTESDADRMEAVVEEAEPNEVPVQEETPEGEGGIPLNELKIGYVVGLSQDGNFVFDLFGSDKGLVELLGIHQHATFRVKRIYEDAQVAGDRLTHEVGKAVALVNQKMDAILQGLRGGDQQRRPDNKLPELPQGQVPQGPAPQQARPTKKVQQKKAPAKKKN